MISTALHENILAVHGMTVIMKNGYGRSRLNCHVNETSNTDQSEFST